MKKTNISEQKVVKVKKLQPLKSEATVAKRTNCCG